MGGSWEGFGCSRAYAPMLFREQVSQIIYEILQATTFCYSRVSHFKTLSAHLWSPVQQRAGLELSRLRAGIEEAGMQVEFWFLEFIWVLHLQGLMDIN